MFSSITGFFGAARGGFAERCAVFCRRAFAKVKALFERDTHADIANTHLFFATSRTEARFGPKAVKNFVKNFRRSSHRRFVAERETLAVERTPGLEGPSALQPRTGRRNSRVPKCDQS
jgi:hypothetical protein